MSEPTLQFLGEQIARLQAEMRDLRGLRSEFAHFRAEVNDRFDSLTGRVDSLTDRVDSLTDRVGAFEKSVESRFEQIQQTAATNLAIVLEAIKAERA